MIYQLIAPTKELRDFHSSKHDSHSFNDNQIYWNKLYEKMEIIQINDFKNKKTYIINEDSKRLDNFNLNYKKIEIENNDNQIKQ